MMTKASSRTVALLFFLLAFAFVGSAFAQYTNLVTDGTFNQITYSGTQAGLTTLYGQFGTGYLTVAGWTTTGYNFVYAPSTVDEGTGTGGTFSGQPKEAPGEYNVNGFGNQYMWGSHNGGTVAWGGAGTIPGGGDFIAADGTFQAGPITQTISGLTAGESYALKFNWGAAQQQSYNTNTSEWWKVSLGGQTEYTSTFSLTTGSFSGWMADTMYFTATNSSETLSFMAGGTPNGQPPFSLLTNVSLEVIPDYSNWMTYAGFGAVCVFLEAGRRRYRRTKLTAAI